MTYYVVVEDAIGICSIDNYGSDLSGALSWAQNVDGEVYDIDDHVNTRDLIIDKAVSDYLTKKARHVVVRSP